MALVGQSPIHERTLAQEEFPEVSLVGWSRRNAEARERRACWFNSLTPEQRQDERDYQAYVGKIWVPSVILTTALLIGFIVLVGPHLDPNLLGFTALVSWPLSMAAPFLLWIKPKSKWLKSRTLGVKHPHG